MLAAGAPSGRQVWLWLLPREQEQLRDLARRGVGLLSGAEQARIGGCANPAVARRFLLGRVLMRRALGAHLGIDPASLEIVPGPNGKPTLIEPARTGLAFNLSSSRSDWAFAVAAGDGLGVDLEPVDRTAPMERIARAFYSAPEQHVLAWRSAGAADEALQLWTLKEAVAKAVGGTVLAGLRGVRLALEAGRIRWLAPPPSGDQARWSLALGRLRHDHWLALALTSSATPASLSASCHVLDGDDDPSSAISLRRLSW